AFDAARAVLPAADGAGPAAGRPADPPPSGHLRPALLGNRGLALLQRGSASAALDDLHRASAQAAAAGLSLLHAALLQNTGCAWAQRGAVDRALDCFDASEARARRQGRQAGALAVDRADALLAAGLPDEAAGQLQRASALPLVGVERAAHLLLNAKHRLAQGDGAAARELARRALHGAPRGSAWAGLARHLEWASQHAPGSAARRIAVTAPLWGHRSEPVRRRRRAVRAASAGDHARARLLLSGGRPPQHLEVSAAHPDRDVAGAALARALRDGRGADALEWAVLAAGPGQNGGACTERRWHSTLARLRSGRAAPLSAQVHQCRPAAPAGHAPQAATADRLAAWSAEGAVAAFLDAGGTRAAVTVVDGRVRVHPLPPREEVGGAVDALAFCLSEAALQGRRAPQRPAERVDRLLLGPVADAVGGRPLLVLPGGGLSGLPWGVLPSLEGRAVSVLSGPAAGPAPAAGGAPMLVSGPGLPGAADEVARIAAALPGAVALTGAAARTGAVLEALPRVAVVHLAGHGAVPPGAPMLSAVQLADGPLTAYDVELLPRAPRVAVLSSCWTGPGAAPSGTPLGLPAALLARGSRAVVAAPVPLPDAATTGPMLAFHAALAAGVPAPRAVADHLAHLGFCCYVRAPA
ncbi:CHAT domain-containing protein, partial [Nocardiopsis coralliicola]